MLGPLIVLRAQFSFSHFSSTPMPKHKFLKWLIGWVNLNPTCPNPKFFGLIGFEQFWVSGQAFVFKTLKVWGCSARVFALGQF